MLDILAFHGTAKNNGNVCISKNLIRDFELLNIVQQLIYFIHRENHGFGIHF